MVLTACLHARNLRQAAIDKQMKELKDMGAPAAEVGNFWDTHVPLVDAEGFPRSDLPIEEVLKGRARLAGTEIEAEGEAGDERRDDGAIGN